MTTLEFLQALWGEDDLPGSLVIWSSNTKRSTWCTDLEAAAKVADRLAASENAFVGMALQNWELAEKRKPGATKSNTRGSEHSVVALPGFWMDIDVCGDGHKEDALPTSIDEAIALAYSLALPPTMIIHTGGGIHCHFLFKEPWELEEDEEREVAKQMLTRLQYTIQMAAKEKGWAVDSTYDLARVLRPAGTFNHKTGEPRPVSLLEYHEERRYLPEDFDPILLEVNKERSYQPKIDPSAILAGIPEGARDTTLFRYACSLRERRMPWEEAEILVYRAADNCTPQFPRDAALEKLRSAWKYPEGTDRQAAKAEASAMVKEIAAWDNDQVFTAETIGALAIIRESDETEYQRIKNSLRGKVPMRDLDGAVKKELAARKEARQELKEAEPRTPLEEVLKNLPVPGLRKPAAWNVNENGIHMAGEKGIIRACPVPVLLTGKYHNLDTAEEKVGIAWIHEGEWRSEIVDGVTAFGNPQILQMRKRGLPVSSVSAKDLIQYLADFEHENQDTLPRHKSVSHLGWVDKKTFIPGLQYDIELDLDHNLKQMASHYKEQGLLEDWMEMIRPLREYPLGRFILAAGFASPLLELLGQRVFLLHAWGNSTVGKSASMKAALSVWGDANETITNFSSTRVALEYMASLRCNLPLGIDERQVAGDKQFYVNELIYMMGGGKGKERGTKTGGLAESTSWRCIVLTNGEQPLTNESSANGLKTRTIEVNGNFIPDSTLAKALHTQTSVYYGTAGPAFIRALVKKEADEPHWVEMHYGNIQEIFDKEYPLTSDVHRDCIATICLGDFLSSIFVWGLDEDEAMDQALRIGRMVMEEMDTRDAQQDMRRSYDAFLGWLTQHEAHFTDDPPYGQRYGVIRENWAYIIPHVLQRGLEDLGFNKDKAMMDWRQAGLIKFNTDSGKPRVDVKVKPMGAWQTHSRLNVVKLNYYEELEVAKQLEMMKDEDQY